MSGGHFPLRFASVRSLAEERSQIFHQQEEMIGVGRARFEVELLVPGARFIILGMNEKRSDTCNFGGLSRAQQCILEQRFAQHLSIQE